MKHFFFLSRARLHLSISILLSLFVACVPRTIVCVCVCSYVIICAYEWMYVGYVLLLQFFFHFNCSHIFNSCVYARAREIERDMKSANRGNLRKNKTKQIENVHVRKKNRFGPIFDPFFFLIELSFGQFIALF